GREKHVARPLPRRAPPPHRGLDRGLPRRQRPHPPPRPPPLGHPRRLGHLPHDRSLRRSRPPPPPRLLHLRTPRTPPDGRTRQAHDGHSFNPLRGRRSITVDR